MNELIKIEPFVVGIVSTNCYLIFNDETKEAIVIDPGGCPSYFLNHIEKEGLEVKAVLLTHGHFDHILGLPDLLEKYPVPVYLGALEKELIEDAAMNGSKSYTQGYTYEEAVYVEDGEILHFLGQDIEVLFTPGHTAGSVCYYFKEIYTLFSGDTLFAMSVGRTDLPTGDSDTLEESIRTRIFELPEETIVYPGHMHVTTVAREKLHNPYVGL